MILSAEQQRAWDAFTIHHEPIPSIDLMERASRRWIEHARPYLTTERILIFAGFGNNGGDALSVARGLSQEGFSIRMVICSFGKKLSTDCLTNYERLPENVETLIPDGPASPRMSDWLMETDLIIDGIFGSGLTRPLITPWSDLIDVINRSAKKVLSIDVPSGLFVDHTNGVDDAIIKAHLTLTFQAPKLNFYLPENATYVGEWRCLDIGLKQEFLSSIQSYHFQNNEISTRALLRSRPKFAHKGHFGHSLIVEGTKNTVGASILAALAATSVGSGYTSVLGDAMLNLNYPEIMLKTLQDIGAMSNYAICIGPGLGQSELSISKLRGALENAHQPMVIDADALNLLSKSPELMSMVPPNSILTPHPRELERLIGPTENSLEQLSKTIDFAKRNELIILIKRAHTVIVLPNGASYFNESGNSGLAKGGSGDVLSGIICGFLAQGYPAHEAARLGVYVHGLAADLCLMEHAIHSFTPSLIINYLSLALKRLGT